MGVLAHGLASGIFRRFVGSPLDWLTKYFKMPHSALSTDFKRETAPHLNDIIEACCDIKYTKVVVRGCTGAGKSTVMECVTAFAIGVEPGDMLIVGQTDSDLKDWYEMRMQGELRACKPIKLIMDSMDRHNIKKDIILFPHMSLCLTGANISGLQAKSMRYCYGDEPHIWKKGMIGQMLARHHDRWNRKTILITQGWETEKDDPHDMDAQYAEGDDRRRGFNCLECGEFQFYQWGQVKFNRVYINDVDLNYDATAKSVYYECEHCKHQYADNARNRRLLAENGSYRACNPYALNRVTSFEISALSVYRISWGDLVIEFLKANEAKKKGVLEPIKDFHMKRLAKCWEIESTAIKDVDVTSMRGKHKLGECPIDPVYVGMFCDIGLLKSYFVVYAFANDGTAFQIDEGTVLDPAEFLDIAENRYYKITGTEDSVGIDRGLVDSGDSTELVYSVCQQSNGILTPSKGSGAQIGTYRQSNLEDYDSLPLITYVDYQAKCSLYEEKIAKKSLPRFWFAEDCSNEFMLGHMGQKKIMSDDKKSKKWKKIPHDDFGDCSKLALVSWWVSRKYITSE